MFVETQIGTDISGVFGGAPPWQPSLHVGLYLFVPAGCPQGPPRKSRPRVTATCPTARVGEGRGRVPRQRLGTRAWSRAAPARAPRASAARPRVVMVHRRAARPRRGRGGWKPHAEGGRQRQRAGRHFCMQARRSREFCDFTCTCACRGSRARARARDEEPSQLVCTRCVALGIASLSHGMKVGGGWWRAAPERRRARPRPAHGW